MARGLDAFDALGDEWDALAARAGTPFLLRAWLTAWCEAFGAHDVMVATVREPDDRLAAAAVLCERRGALGTPSNKHSGDWDAVAVDDAARRMLWEGIAALGQLRLAWLRGDSRATSIAGEALASAGYHTLLTPQTASPYLEFPATWQELLARRSANLRQQWRRRRGALERQGLLALRVTTGGDDLERDLSIRSSRWSPRAGRGDRRPR